MRPLDYATPEGGAIDVSAKVSLAVAIAAGPVGLALMWCAAMAGSAEFALLLPIFVLGFSLCICIRSLTQLGGSERRASIRFVWVGMIITIAWAIAIGGFVVGFIESGCC